MPTSLNAEWVLGAYGFVAGQRLLDELKGL